MNARLPSWQRDPRLERNHGSQAAMAAVAAPPAASHAAAAPPQIDLSDSDSNSSASGSCEIVELVGNKGKTSFVCLSGDVRRVR